MMTGASTTHDPRQAMAPAGLALDRTQPIAEPQYLDLTALTRRGTSPAGTTWTLRGQNAFVHYVQVERHELAVAGTFRDETLLVCATADSAAVVEWDGRRTSISGQGVAIVPPGQVRVEAAGTGDLALLVRTDEPAWAGTAVNEEVYAHPAPRVAPADPWPAPVGDPAVRVHLVADHPAEEGRFGWIFRSRSFMVNFVPPHDGPRDPRHLSPHHHDDFEQYSLAVQGEFVHHIRTPWVKDGTQWREDDHVSIGSPSLTLIPPPTIHTSAGSGPGRNLLVDIFSPPRVDFSQQPGWVLNAEEHPQP
ncbi:hypothetical protein RDV89_07175 [Nocardioides zeae]|uniref:Uncharacterized protein n=1 Tax=Nocardioides imazamoxiresistens TaxID=3231893 RepID=A0ABU3PUE4_9ACTN|nr:hypothetical protein [Nocardioides zeae]MDT9592843.1 hypothetical protein [Nocardioides zeae]